MKVADCDKMHQDKGWESCGYNFLVHMDGKVESARGLEKIGAHVKGYNSTSVGIAFVMDGRKQLLTQQAVVSFRRLVRLIRSQYGWMPMVGHNDLAATICPSSHIYGTVVTPDQNGEMYIEALREK